MLSTAPQVLILRALGINCELETARALEHAGAAPRILHLNELLAQRAVLCAARLLVLPGGFSYGDDISAGRILGSRLRHELAGELADFVKEGGFVLGVCNGFQALVELGLLEGLHTQPSDRRIALTSNDSNRYECRWVHLKNEKSRAAWLDAGRVWPCPVAHGEGKVALAPGALDELSAGGRVLLRYVNGDGSPAEYPACPNGSTDRIAGLCDASGRVVGLMPHPERNVSPFHHPHWTRIPEREAGEGLRFFQQLVGALRG